MNVWQQHSSFHVQEPLNIRKEGIIHSLFIFEQRYEYCKNWETRQEHHKSKNEHRKNQNEKKKRKWLRHPVYKHNIHSLTTPSWRQADELVEASQGGTGGRNLSTQNQEVGGRGMGEAKWGVVKLTRRFCEVEVGRSGEGLCIIDMSLGWKSVVLLIYVFAPFPSPCFIVHLFSFYLPLPPPPTTHQIVSLAFSFPGAFDLFSLSSLILLLLSLSFAYTHSCWCLSICPMVLFPHFPQGFIGE